MQLTRLDRWLLRSFVHETHIHTVSAPTEVPSGITEKPVPGAAGRNFKHHYIASSEKTADRFIHLLRQSGQMFSTQVVDRKAWYVPYIAPSGRSFTWRIVWIVFICLGGLTGLHYGRILWMNPVVRENLADALRILNG